MQGEAALAKKFSFALAYLREPLPLRSVLIVAHLATLVVLNQKHFRS